MDPDKLLSPQKTQSLYKAFYLPLITKFMANQTVLQINTPIFIDPPNKIVVKKSR